MGKCFIGTTKDIRECSPDRCFRLPGHSKGKWEDCPFGKKKQLEQAAPALYEALKAVKDGTVDTRTADNSMNVHVLRHSAWENVCAALALVDGEEVVNAD